MMDSILDSLTAEKLYPSGGTNLLDLEELSDGDFLTNVVRLFFLLHFYHRKLLVLFLFLSFFFLPSTLKSNAPTLPVPPGAGPQEGGVAVRS